MRGIRLNGTNEYNAEEMITEFLLLQEQKRVVKTTISKEEETYPDEIKEIMEFVRKPESMPYLKLAYAQYKVNVAEENVKRLEAAILNQSTK